MAKLIQKRENPTTALRWLLTQVALQRGRQLSLTFFLMIAGGFAEVVSIGAVIPFLAVIIDPELAAQSGAVRFIFNATGLGERYLIPLVATLLVASAVIAVIIRLLLTWQSNKFVLDVGHDISVQIYDRMLHQSYAFFVTRNTSELVSGIEKVQMVIFAVLLPIIQAVVAFFVAIFIIAILMIIDPVSAALAALFMGGTYGVISATNRHVLARNSGVLASSQTQRIRLVQEALGGLRDIIIDQSQQVFQQAFTKVDRAYRHAQTINLFISAAPRFVIEGTGLILLTVLILSMSRQPGGVMAAVPVIGALAFGAQRLLPLLQMIYSGWSQFVGAGDLLTDVKALLVTPVVKQGLRRPTNGALPFTSTVELAEVSYWHAGKEKPALDAINLQIRQGERVGIIGKTGSGKTTLIDLLMGLLEPGQGTMLVDGVVIDEHSRARWQCRVAHVPQSIFLADADIAANIAFGEDPASIDRERVRAAADAAHLSDFVTNLPEGFNTSCGERGVQLSGGQRQRIGIARALYRNADVLILDEATSALDDETEAAVMRSLDGLGRNLTIIMVAHRLSTLSDCDRLIRLDQGRINAVGSFAELTGGAGHSRLSP